jgi:hypothetical protein
MAPGNASDPGPGVCDDQIKLLLDKLDGAVEKYSTARQWHFFEICLGMAIAVVGWYICNLWYQGALSRRQKDKRMRQAVEALNEMDPEQLKRLFREGNMDMPAWLVNPDYERPGWVNDIIEQLWPRIGRIMEERLSEVLEQVLDENSPRWITGVKLTRLTMGDKPPEITSVKVYKGPSGASAGRDEVTLDCDFMWSGNQEAQLIIKPLPKHLQLTPLQPAAKVLGNIIVLKVGMEDFNVSGKMRVTMRPLLDRTPVVGAMKFSLVQPPKYHYHLSLYGGDLTLLPGVEAWLDSVINDCVIQSYMIPDGYVMPLVDGDLMIDLPQGILFVRLIEVVNVPKTDWLGKCDPYVIMWTRSSRKSKSSTKHNTYHPRWEDAFDSAPYVFLVQEPDVQRLHIELYDWDVMGKEKIGTGQSQPIEELPAGEPQELWIPIELETAHNKGGDWMEEMDDTLGKVKQHLKLSRHRGECRVHLQVTYQPIGKDEVQRIREGEDTEDAEDDQVHDYLKGGILYVYIKQAVHLVRKARILNPIFSAKSQVKVEVADQVQYTTAGRGKHGDLTFDDRLEFILPGHVADDNDLMVHFEVWDYRLINTFQGRLDLPLADVKRQHHMKGEYRLEGVRQGELRMEMQWMGILEGA